MHIFLHFRVGHGLVNIVNRKFMWNSFLVKKMEQILHPDWVLTIVHGFVAQSIVCLYGKHLYLTLIARRSAHYAGTRFLKRGANFEVYYQLYFLLLQLLKFDIMIYTRFFCGYNDFRVMLQMKWKQNK